MSDNEIIVLVDIVEPNIVVEDSYAGNFHYFSSFNKKVDKDLSTYDEVTAIVDDAFVYLDNDGSPEKIEVENNGVLTEVSLLTKGAINYSLGLKQDVIIDNGIGNDLLAQMPTMTIKGNDTASTANAKDLTVVEVMELLSPSGTMEVPHNLKVYGNIEQVGGNYETHQEQVYTTKDHLILRDGAVGGLGTGSYAGLFAKLADGTNNAGLVFDGDGMARVGDIGTNLASPDFSQTQVLATRQDTPAVSGIPYWNATLKRFDTNSWVTFDGSSIVTTNVIRSVAGVGHHLTLDNSFVNTAQSGTKISRNVADPHSALKVDLTHASSTGNILELQHQGVEVASVSKTGVFSGNGLDIGGGILHYGQELFRQVWNISSIDTIYSDITTLPSGQGNGTVLPALTGGALPLKLYEYNSTLAEWVYLVQVRSHTLYTVLGTGKIYRYTMSSPYFIEMTNKYNNATSGLTATSVQEAIDELATSGGGGGLNEVTITNDDVVGVPLTVNAVVGTTANLINLQYGGVNKLEVTKDGWLSQDGVRVLHTFSHPTGETAIPRGFNVFLGQEAGNLTMGATAISTDHASYNVGIGCAALNANTTGSDNTANGGFALYRNTTGTNNTANGRDALRLNTTGKYNTANGSNALMSNTTGSNNTASGKNALFLNTTGSDNIANGYRALYRNTTGTSNIANGGDALMSNTTGSNNTASGIGAGRFFGSSTSPLTLINNSVFIGANSRANADDETNEIVIGYEALGKGSNTATIGNTSLTGLYLGSATAKLYGLVDYDNTTSGLTATSVQEAIDELATSGGGSGGGLNEVTITNDDIASVPLTISAIAGTTANLQSWQVNGVNKLEVTKDGWLFQNGVRLLHTFSHPTGSTAIPIGGNVFLGQEAGNLTMGSTATSTYHGSYNVGVGYQALYSNTTGSYNTANGYQALFSNTTGRYNTANGYKALYANTTGSYNTANGYNALLNNVSGADNTANGYLALYSNTTGRYNTANGRDALLNNVSGANNTANGYKALMSNTTGSYNTANGYLALYFNTTGSYNTANGYQALLNNVSGANNTANGRDALLNNVSGANNTANGRDALGLNTTGSNNTANGYEAGRYYGSGTSGLTKINNSIFIGANSRANADNETNEIVIGYEALGKGSNTATIGNTSLTGLYLGSATAKLYGLVDYDNTTSGLTATSVQEAIDELSTSSGGGGDGGLNEVTITNDDTASVPLTVNAVAGTTANLLNLQVNGANKLEVTKDGWLSQNGTILLHTFSHPTGSTAIPDGRNVFIGQEAGNLTMGSTAISTSHASYNIGIGYQALRSNTTGSSNTANGYAALYSNTTGTNNTADGYAALRSNTTGTSNIANGCMALYNNTTGSSNTANGMYALYSNTTGTSNTANGVQAGRFFGSGTSELTNINNSIFIGMNSRANADNETNEIVIGYEALGKGSNTATIGNSSLTGLYLGSATAKLYGLVDYDNTTSGLTATSVQEAIDELSTIEQRIADIYDELGDIDSALDAIMGV